MIKLTKLDKPEILKVNAVAWTQVLLDCAASGAKATDADKSKYRHPDVKSILILETHGKCAYCESKLLHSAYGDVEHIVPKSTKIEVTFDWDNLTIACDVCNTNKGGRFSNGIGFVDPYVHEPTEHFYFLGSYILSYPGNDDARLTEEVLKLNRTELMERRLLRIRNLREHVEVIKKAPADLRAILLENLNEEMTSDKEFSAVARACIPIMLSGLI